MNKKVLIVLAEGFEEIEAITSIDVLRRAEVEVVVAGVDGLSITGAHGITVQADTDIEDIVDLVDAVVLPGGLPGADNLANSKALKGYLEKMHAAGRHIAAICAAPAVVLASTSVLDDHTATCYPGFEDRFGDSTIFSSDRVVTECNITTSRGPGTAMEFSLSLVTTLVGSEAAALLEEQMLV
ncbi:MAG TPA: DJ-1 family glyoxalase III [Xanthomonadales bacterium]|nr:DJ-1 family glyoxalase III [Xanthomonadales bacterium]